MHRLFVALLAAVAVASGATVLDAQTVYFPAPGQWERRMPAQAGFDAAALADAIQFASANENPMPRDLLLYQAITRGPAEPFDTPIGPSSVRGPVSGVIIRNGYLVAEWGEPARVDMTFSVTKTFLTTVVGLAVQKGLIKDVNDRARSYMPPDVDLFEAPKNQPITWDHLLRQTSDWQGTLWGKPDWADRPVGQPAEWPNRPVYAPGTHYKYNDVRVNVMALAALHVLRRPLPEVLREELMEPIGASSTWRWHGYENSYVELDGRRVQSVAGGGHWGGGMFINAYDMARFGYLFLRNGKWKDRQLVSEQWMAQARTPGSDNAEYGYANWYLNPGRKRVPAAPDSAVTFNGDGPNIVYIDWQNDVVMVVRWIRPNAFNEFVGKMLGALRPQATAAR